jgi:hypothetical protein
LECEAVMSSTSSNNDYNGQFCCERYIISGVIITRSPNIFTELNPSSYPGWKVPFSYPEPFLRAVNRRRRGGKSLRRQSRTQSHRWVALATRDWKTILIGRSISYWTHTPCGQCFHFQGNFLF